jgi:hypothetical protein
MQAPSTELQRILSEFQLSFSLPQTPFTMGQFTLSYPGGDILSISRIVPVGLPLLLVILISFTILRRLFQRSIPNPNFGLPIIGDASAYSNDPVSFVRDATAKIGPVFRVNMLLNSLIFLRADSMNKMYLETREEVWSFGDGMVCDLPFFWEM